MLPALRTFTLTLIAVVFIATSLSVVAAPATPAKVRSLPVHTAYDAPTAPPSDPVYEITPGEREGHTWCSGYWQWNGEKYTWHSGYWVKNREGYIWTSESWAKRGEKWRLNPGHWEKLAPENSTAREDAEEAEEVDDTSAETAPVTDTTTEAAPAPTTTKSKTATKKTTQKPRKKVVINKNYAPAHPSRR